MRSDQMPGNKPGIGGRLMAILCVGIAYFVIAVVFPLVMFLSGQSEWPEMRVHGLTFAGLAGVAGLAAPGGARRSSGFASLG